MSMKIRRYRVDDLAIAGDPTAEVVADETIRFAVNGKEYEIDLTAENAGKFRGALAPYTAAGRVTKRTRPPRPAAARIAAVRIREWARERGIAVKDMGRIPGPVLARYEAEQLQPTA